MTIFEQQQEHLVVFFGAVAAMRNLQIKAQKSKLSPDWNAAAKAEKVVDGMIAKVKELNPPDDDHDLFGAI